MMSQENSGQPDQPTVAQRIREARERHGLTQAALAARMGVARPMIAQWETGARHPWINTLKRLAEALEVPYEWLAFGEAGSTQPGKTSDVDPFLLATVHAVVKRAFDERALESENLFFFQVVASIYAVAYQLQLKEFPYDSLAFQARLRDSVLKVLSA